MFGLDLWFKPLAIIHRWSRAGPLGANLFYLTQCVAQGTQPGVLVLADQAHAPGECVAATAGHADLHERVQYPALGLPQPGHHRDRECGEHHFPALAHHAPGHLAVEPHLGLAGDANPRVAGLLAEPPAPPRRQRLSLSTPLTPALSRSPPLHRRKLPDDRDLLTIHNHLRFPGKPPLRDPPQEPRPYLPSSISRSTLLLRTHVIMITELLRTTQAPGRASPSPGTRFYLQHAWTPTPHEEGTQRELGPA